MVIVFFDIHEGKTAGTDLVTTRQDLAHSDAIVDTVRGSLLLLDKEFVVTRANASFSRTFREEPAHTVGRHIFELGNRQWGIPRLRELLEKILPERGSFKDFEVEQEFPGIGRHRMLLNAPAACPECGRGWSRSCWPSRTSPTGRHRLKGHRHSEIIMDTDQKRQLRHQAEERLDEKFDHLQGQLDDESLRLLHELKAHQVELELRNDELRRTQLELEQARDRYVDLFEASPVGLLTLDRDGVIQEANRTAAELFGRKREHLLGVPFQVRLAERDQELFQQFLGRCSNLGRQNVAEFRLQRPAGMVLDARIECLTCGPEGKREHRMAIIDLTAQKKLERREIQAQKLESLDVLAGGIAHDFNNLLTAMLGNISLARLYLPPEPLAAREKMEMAEKAALRAQGLTRRLLTFARGGEPAKKPVAVAEVVREAAGLPLTGAPHHLDFDFPSDLWPAMADAVQLGQVVQNLVINAIQAMPQGGEIEIWGRNVELAADNELELPAGRYVGIAIRDQGRGIAPGDLEKIFDPYFSTKGEGSGLGLSVAHSVIARHGGRLTVDSTPGQGTLFEILLPAAAEREVSAPAPLSEETFPGWGRILLMDDEDSVREVMVELIRHLGYEVETARDGEETLALFRQAGQEGRPYAAVILDLVVPTGMGGEEAVAELHKIDPEVRAIVSTGYSDVPAARDYKAFGFCAALPKPYRLPELSRVLREVLTGTCEETVKPPAT